MRPPIWVAIPFRGLLAMTFELVVELLDQGDVDHLLLLDNGTSPDDPDWALLPVRAVGSMLPCDELTLTQMWNRAWDYVLAVEGGPAALAILNNDITVPPAFLSTLRDALYSDDGWWAVCPDHGRRVAEGVELAGVRQVHGVGVDRPELPGGGMAGWAFMVRTEARRAGLPPIDEQFEWFCGDDDLVLSIEAAGHAVGLVEGLPCDHIRSVTLAGRPELIEQTRRDVVACRTKWGA